MRNPVSGALVACILIIALPASVHAQVSFPSPLAPRAAGSIDDMTGLPVMEADAARVRQLAQLDRIVLTGFQLAEGPVVDLELRRLDLDRYDFGFQVNGQEAPGLLAGLDLSVWTGRVAGQDGTEAVLSFSNRGTSGWVNTGERLVHLLPRAGDGNDWSRSVSLMATEADLAERGMELGAFCNVADIDLASDGRPLHEPEIPLVEFGSGPAEGLGDCAVREATMAIETDFQLYEVFGDLGAETAYMTTLLSAISDRYEEQIDTILTFPYVQLYTTSADPWTQPDIPGGMSDMLAEFEAAWSGNIPGGAGLGHFISGAQLGGGIAYVGVLCDTGDEASFAVSGNIAGQVPFPIVVSPLNWDFMVIAHETGHNFNSPHTHDYNPQIDNCPGGACITDGTIMSYCHQCTGGLANITTYFHPTVVARMKAHADSCLPLRAPLVEDVTAQPTIIAPDTTTAVTVELQGIPLSTIDLNWRAGPSGPFTAIPMSDQGGNIYGADLPAPVCGNAPEWYYSVTDQDCGPYQTATYSAEVGDVTTIQALDMETDPGWTVGAVTDLATTGVWERGDPIGTGAQPDNDVTGLGTDCWFTGQGSDGGSLGENDVDDGATTLTTSVIDLSAGDARVSYWRWYSNDSGSTPNADVFTVDITNDGTNWTNVETVGPAGEGTSGGWIFHQFTVSDFVTPNASVQLRFVAEDADEGSIVEAAIDEFAVFTVECSGVVCQEDLGFGGPGAAVLSLCGGDLSTGTSGDLLLSGATPNGTAFLFAGLVNAPTPAEGGMLVPVPWSVHFILPIDGSGDLNIVVPGGDGPVTFYVQYGYTDPAQVLGFGFSNALEVNLLP